MQESQAYGEAMFTDTPVYMGAHTNIRESICSNVGLRSGVLLHDTQSIYSQA